MGDRTNEREATVDAGEADDGRAVTPSSVPDADRGEVDTATERDRGIAGSVRRRGATAFSPRAFGLRTVVFATGGVLAGWLPLVGGALAALLSVFAVAFLLGLVASRRRYAEAVAAGVLIGGLAGTLDFLPLAAIGIGLPAVALAAGSGGLAALSGTYFGRDLRDGLTREL